MFSSEDIRKLLDIFPPATPSLGNKPSLIRSFSGNHLVRSDVARKTFEQILHRGQTPIRISSLPNTLGIESAQWLLDEGQSDIVLGRDGQSILPAPVQDTILSEFLKGVHDAFLDQEQYAASKGISSETLVQLLDRRKSGASFDTITCQGSKYSCSEKLLEDTRKSISRILINGSTSGGSLNLSSEHQEIPPKVLQTIAESILADHQNTVQGRISYQQDGVHFSPDAAAKEAPSSQLLVDSAIERLEANGFCYLNELLTGHGSNTALMDVVEQVRALYQQQHSEDVIHIYPETIVKATNGVRSQDAAEMLVCQSLFDRRQNDLSEAANRRAIERWSTRELGQDIAFDESVIQGLSPESHSKDLDTAILKSTHAEPIISAFTTTLLDLQNQTTTKLSETIQTQLQAPFKLYTNGLSTISDQTLTTNVSDFLKTQFRTETIPSILTALRAEKSVPNKASLTELDRFQRNVKDATSLADIATAIKKLARKLKTDQPSPTQLSDIKTDTLIAKARAMGKMKRGSDLLQNLVWVLLATSTSTSMNVDDGSEDGNEKDKKKDGIQCLFMSSGKDTSRMIKFCKERCRDEDISMRLDQFRDAVKAGNETEEHRSEMRRMADVAVRGKLHENGST